MLLVNSKGYGRYRQRGAAPTADDRAQAKYNERGDDVTTKRTTVSVPMELFEGMRDFFDACWRGPYDELPATMLGHYVSGNRDGVRLCAERSSNMHNSARQYVDDADEWLAKAKGTWDKVPR